MNSKVLFIGRTNTRLSRFAEGLFNSVAQNHALRWKALSRGLASHESDTRIDPQLLKELPNWQIEPSHLAASKLPLTVRDLMSAKKLILWESELPLMKEKCPTWAEKVECWSFAHEGPLIPLANRVFELLEELGAGPIQRRALLKKKPQASQKPAQEQAQEQVQARSLEQTQPPSQDTVESETDSETLTKAEVLNDSATAKPSASRNEPPTQPKQKQPTQEQPSQSQSHQQQADKTQQNQGQSRQVPAEPSKPSPTPAQASQTKSNSPAPIQAQFPFEDSVPLTRAVKAAMRLRAFG